MQMGGRFADVYESGRRGVDFYYSGDEEDTDTEEEPPLKPVVGATVPKRSFVEDEGRRESEEISCDSESFASADECVAQTASRCDGRRDEAEWDVRWLEVTRGLRFTRASAMESYPRLTGWLLGKLPHAMARRPAQKCVVHTYLKSDIEKALEMDPTWAEVLSGRRYTRALALREFPLLSDHYLRKLPYKIARQPTVGTGVRRPGSDAIFRRGRRAREAPRARRGGGRSARAPRATRGRTRARTSWASRR